jgi:hypothetical protein
VATASATQGRLFDLGQRPDDETPVERARRQNRERQLTWRRKHQQFFVPLNAYDERPATFTTCCGGR